MNVEIRPVVSGGKCDRTPVRGKILLVTSSYPKTAGEPSGVFLHLLSKELANLGWRVLVLAPNFPGGRSHEFIDGIEIRRFTYFIPNCQLLCYRSGILPNLRRSPYLWLLVPFYLTSLLCAMLRCIARDSVNVIHAHWIVPQGVVTWLMRAFTRTPVVLTVHGGDVFAFQGRIGKRLKRLALKGARICTANSRSTREQVLKSCSETPIRVLPMGVDTAEFQPLSQGATLRNELQVRGEMILFVGRLVRKKGLHQLLLAMPDLLKDFPSAVLVVIGDGAQRDQLELMVRQLGIAESVRFLGKLPHHILPQYYNSADVFVGPSVVDSAGDTEGLGVVFLEAAAAGLAMIGSSVGGISDILIHERTGLVVEPDEPNQLLRAIKRLLSDAELRLRLGQAARSHILTQFTWDRIAREFSKIFEEILQPECETDQ